MVTAAALLLVCAFDRGAEKRFSRSAEKTKVAFLVNFILVPIN